ncbi:VOC family protein [Hydrogenophaga sp. XSHU_21]
MKTKQPTQSTCPAHATAYEHVGIRVSDPDQARRFYERLGFHEEIRFDDYANEMATPAGVRINLIFNGAARAGARNMLHDEPVKWPGITHVAFVVEDLDALVNWLNDAGIAITEGPGPIGPRRVGLFIRDPDGNVLEFNQLL